MPGDPDFPLAEPGTAVSPGAKICILVKAPAVTRTPGLVFEALELSLMSLAVSVEVPAVRRETLKVWVPFTSAALAGKSAFASDEVIPATSVMLLMIFQLASTALTVTLNALPAVRALGAPDFPLTVPGAAVSPGTNSCSFVNEPAFTAIDGLVLLGIAVCVTLLEVSVALPAVFRVTLKVLLPLTNGTLPGKAAFASLEVIETVSFVFTTFQLASTALTVTLNAPPAV